MDVASIQGIINCIFCIFISVEGLSCIFLFLQGVISVFTFLSRGSSCTFHLSRGSFCIFHYCPGVLLPVQGVILRFNSCPEGHPTCSFLSRGHLALLSVSRGLFCVYSCPGGEILNSQLSRGYLQEYSDVQGAKQPVKDLSEAVHLWGGYGHQME